MHDLDQKPTCFGVDTSTHPTVSSAKNNNCGTRPLAPATLLRLRYRNTVYLLSSKPTHYAPHRPRPGLHPNVLDKLNEGTCMTDCVAMNRQARPRAPTSTATNHVPTTVRGYVARRSTATTTHTCTYAPRPRVRTSTILYHPTPKPDSDSTLYDMIPLSLHTHRLTRAPHTRHDHP